MGNNISARVRSDRPEGDETTLAPGPDAVNAIRPLQCQLRKTAIRANGRTLPRPPREWNAALLKVPLSGAFGIVSQLLANHSIRYLEESFFRSGWDCRSSGGMMTASLSPDSLAGGLHDSGQVETASDQLSGRPRGHLDSVLRHRKRNDRQVSCCAFLI